MAELSTIARPYASGLMKALQERKAGADEVAEVLQALQAICAVAQDPQVATLVGDPKLTDDQLFNLIEDFIISAGYNGNPGKTRISRYACSNAFNIVAPSGKQPGNPT